MEARTGITEQADRTSRMGQAKQDIQKRTDRTGQDNINWTYRTGKAEWDRQNRAGRIGGCLPLQDNCDKCTIGIFYTCIYNIKYDFLACIYYIKSHESTCSHHL